VNEADWRCRKQAERAVMESEDNGRAPRCRRRQIDSLLVTQWVSGSLSAPRSTIPACCWETYPAPRAVSRRLGAVWSAWWVSIPGEGCQWGCGWEHGLGPLPGPWLSPGVAHVGLVLVMFTGIAC
jgi:hypothetical protein